jgi:hypothetical protein
LGLQSKNVKKSFLLGLLAGVGAAFVFGLLVFFIFIFNLPSWKSHWLLETTRLLAFERKINLQKPQIIYSSPPRWNFMQTEPSPKNYHKNRDLSYYPKQNQSYKYFKDLEMLAGSEKAAFQRGEFLTSWLNEIKSLGREEKQAQLNQLIGYQIGYLPSIPASYTMVRKTDKLISIAGRYGAVFRSLTLSVEAPKGVVIALHGRGSSPEGVIGTINDYANQFGAYWHKAGYAVIAPDVSNNDELNFPRLGLSNQGADIALIFDLLEYVKHQYDENIPIIIAGISYGSALAELVGILSADIDAVVSIGGASRYSYNYSMYSLPSNTPVFSHYLSSFLDSGGVYDLVLPKKLIISVGNYDAGNWGRIGENKIFILNNFVERHLGDRAHFRINLFHGEHEADPINEIKLYEQLLEPQN